MRSQTPIQQQRTTQTQQRRGRPHNPSITRRNQPCRQRASPLRQMQQQTRQRQRRQRKSTPLPEKPGRKRQTTHRRHAHRTLLHMVNHHRHSKHTEERRKSEERRGVEEKRRGEDSKGTCWCSGITCVLAGLRAHYPEHQHKRKDKTRQDKQQELHTPSHHRHSTTHT